MNKAQLVEKLAEDYQFTKVFARELVDTVFDSMVETIQKGGEVSISEFGNFKVAERQPAWAGNHGRAGPSRLRPQRTSSSSWRRRSAFPLTRSGAPVRNSPEYRQAFLNPAEDCFPICPIAEMSKTKR